VRRLSLSKQDRQRGGEGGDAEAAMRGYPVHGKAAAAYARCDKVSLEA
jgi:hypothetical protein